jgi:prepilin-type N-terminal cleavage/methylation domain-containing protein
VLFVTFRPKLKKQAFTLIELMAVVIILGIVTTITVTAINYSIKASKDRLYAEQVKRLEAGVASWATENSSFLPVDSSGVVFFSISRLKDEGIVDTEVVMDPRTSNELDGCMTIKYDNTYQQYEYQYEDSDCSLVEDAYLPVITVTGGDAQTAEVNGYYEFPTADSVDYSGRSVTVEGPIIKKDGTIVTNLDLSLVDDVYELIYESIDPKLNLTATKTITLTVVDTVAPVVTVSSSTINHEAGDTFTPATVLVSDNSCGETGIDTSVNNCITTLTPSINSGGFSPIIPGTYPIYYTATDSSGNIRVAVVNVVVADTQGPNISALTYRLNTSAGAAYAGAWTKENVWVGNISAPDQGSGLREYRYYLTTTGDTCSTSYGSYTTLPNTTTEFTITNSHNGKLCFWAVDNVFNASIIREQAILIDKVVPVCGTWTPTVSPWKNSGGQSFTLAGSTDSGGSLINVAGGNCTTAASNGATCNIVISDNATNTTTCTSPVNNFETVAPIINFINTSTSSSYYNNASFVAITNPVSAQDVTSGLTQFRYEWTTSVTNPTNMNSTTCTGGTLVSFTNGTTSEVSSTTSIDRPIASGIHYLHVCAQDDAGNINKTSSIYYLDMVGPGVSASNASSSWFTSRTTTISAIDTGGSGIAEVRYQWNTNGMNGACTTGGTVTTHNAVLTVPSGSNRLYICARDNVGNTGVYDSGADQFRVDAGLPTITYTNTGSWYRASTLPTNTISVQDTLSGLGVIRYAWTTSTTDPTNITATTCSGGTGITVTAGTVLAVTDATTVGKPTTSSSTHYLHVCARDSAGNIVKSSSRYYLDIDLPVVSASNASSSWFTSRTTTITATDTGGSAIAEVRYQWNTNGMNAACTSGGTVTAHNAILTVPEGSNRLYVCARDTAGNAQSYDSGVDQFRVDSTAPTAPNITRTSASPTDNATVSFSLSATDTQSGVAQMQFSCNNSNWSALETYATTKSINVTNLLNAGCTTTSEEKTIYARFTNGAGQTSSIVNATVVYDITSPVLTINYTDGYNTSGVQSITFTATDAESGVGSITLYRQSATLSNGTCGAYGSWGSLGTQTSPYSDITMGSGNCYRYYVSATNGVGNSGTTSTTPTAATKVDTSDPIITTTYTNGYNTSGTQSITMTATDAQSGVSSSFVLYRRQATLTNNTCGTYGGWTSLGTTTSPYSDTTMGSGYCYQYYSTGTNGANLTGESSTSPSLATKVDTSAPASISVGYTDGYNTTGSQSVTFSATDAQSGIASYTLYRQSATLTAGVCGTYGAYSSLGTQTSPYTDSSMTSGNCYRYYVRATNNATLFDDSTQTPTAATKVDVAGVTVSANNASSTWFASRTTTVTAADTGGSGIAEVRYQWNANGMNAACTTGGTVTTSGSALAVPSGSNRLYLCARDTAGNTAQPYDSGADQFRVDTTGPIVAATNASTSWFATRTTTVSATDTQSGLAEMRYSWNSNPMNAACTSGGTIVTTGTALTVPSGSNRLYMCARDNVGNPSTYDSGADQFRVDTTGPAISATNASSSWFTSRTTTVSATDTQSGLAEMRYSWNSNPMNLTCTTGGTIVTTGTALTVPNGSNRLYICARDNVGNYSTYDSGADQFRVDSTAPTPVSITRTSSSPTDNPTVSFSLSATDSESGVAQMQFSCNNTNWSALETYATTKSINVTNLLNAGCSTTSELKTIYARFTNNVPLTSVVVSATVLYDNTDPLLSISYTNGYNTIGTQSITFTATDAESGVGAITLYRQSATLSNGICGAYGAWGSLGTQTSPYTDITMGSGNCYRYYASATNGAGRTATTSTSPTSETKVDTSAPVVNIVYTNGYNTSGTQSITFSASDAQSNISGGITIWRRSATLSNGTCGTYGAGSSLGTQVSPYTDTTMGSGNCYKYYAVASNGATLTGDSGQNPTEETKVDTSGVVLSASNTSSSWFASRTTTVSATDAQSGVLEVRYSWNSNPMNASCTTGGTVTTHNAVLTVPAGSNRLYMCARNNAGNTPPTTYDSGADQFRVDAALPTITYTNTGSWYDSSSLPANTISAQDTISGLSTIRYAWTTSTTDPTNITATTCSGGTAITVTAGTTSAVTNATATGKPTTSGSTHYLHVCASDTAGNIVKSSSRYYLDIDLPTITYTNTGSWYRLSTLPANTISVQDTISGLSTIRYAWTASTTDPTNITATTCSGGTAITVTAGTTSAVTNATATGKPTTSSSTHYLHVCATDTAGNIVKSSSRYYLDVDLPAVNASNASSSWFTSRTTTISATDTGGSTLAEVRYQWNTNGMNAACTTGGTVTAHNAILTVPEGSNRLYVCARDVAGNAQLHDSGADMFRVDTTGPVVSASNASSSWFSTRTTTISATDTGSGVADVRYSWNSNPMNASCTTGGTVTTHNAVLTVPAGSNRLYVCARDSAGNPGNPYDSGADMFRVDAALPTITYTNTGSWYRLSTLPANTISVQDTISGLSTIRYAWTASTTDPTNITATTCSGGTAITVTAGTTSAVTNATATGKPTTSSSTHYLHVCASDTAGNIVKSSSRYYLDIDLPAVNASNASSSWFTSRTTTISATDTGGSTLAEVRYQWNTNGMDGACTTGGATTTNGAILTVPEGSNRLYVCARDVAGNAQPYDSGADMFRVDTTPPVLTVNYTDGYNTTGSQSVTFTATDAQSGISGGITIWRQSATLSNGTCGTYGAFSTLGTQVSPYTDSTMGSGNCYRYYSAANNGAGDPGDSGQSPTAATKVDTTGPTITTTYTDGYNTSGTQSITMTAIDAQSGESSDFVLYRRQATLSNNTCGTYGTWSSLGTTTSPYTDTTMGSGYCYQYYSTGSNGVPMPGQSTTSPSLTTKVDTSGVVLSANNASSTWYASRTTTVSAADAQSGVLDVRYQWNTNGMNASCTSGGTITTHNAVLTVPESSNRLYMCARNNAGNTPPTTYDSGADQFRVDSTNPVTSATNASSTWFASRTTTVSATDTGGSGVAQMRYQWNTNGMDSTCTTGGTIVTSGTALTVPEGSNRLYVCSRDNVGNSSGTAIYDSGADQFRVDSTNPVTNATNASSTWFASRTTTVSATDTGGSGVVQMRYQWNTNGMDSTCTTGGTIVTSGTALTVPEGSNRLYVCSRDNVGNSSGTAIYDSGADQFRVDTTNPAFPQVTSGTMKFRDPSFASGSNSMSVYNNSGGGTVSHVRTAMTTPTGSGYAIRITNTGTASPGIGGFVQYTTSSANGVYAHVILARIPVGYTIARASNAIGDGATHTWITDTAGTGDWKEYIYISRAGSTGTFGTLGHVYLNGAVGTPSVPVIWDVAYATMIDKDQWGTTGSLIFQATDTGGSNVVSYGINTSSTIEPTYTSVTSAASIGIDARGYTANNTYYVWAKDAVGNTSNASIVLNRIDSTAPVVSISYDEYSTTTTHSVTFSATDAESGFGAITLYKRSATLSNGTCGSYDSWSSLGTQTSPYIDSSIASGNCYQYYASTSNGAGTSGNSGTNPSQVTKVDTSAPVLTWSRDGSTTYSMSQCTTPTYSDPESGIATGTPKYSWSTLVSGVEPAYDMPSGSSRCYNTQTTTTHRIHGKVCNNAGTCILNITNVFYVDLTDPTSRATASPTPTCSRRDVIAVCTNKVQYTFTNMHGWWQDAHSGITGGSARTGFTHNGATRYSSNTGYLQYATSNSTYVYNVTYTSVRDNAGNEVTGLSVAKNFTSGTCPLLTPALSTCPS